MTSTRTALHITGALGRAAAVALLLPLAAWAEAPPEDPRPSFSLTTGEAFDAGSIPPYAGNHEAVYAHIDAHLKEHEVPP